MKSIDSLKANLALRPWWMNGLMLFCAYMTFIYLPWDVFLKPLSEDQEVWFGILFTGWPAKIGALLHWFVYGFGFYGFGKMKSWMKPWASIYTLQIAIGMAVWTMLDSRGSGLTSGLVVGAVFVALAAVLFRTSLFGQAPAETAVVNEDD